MHYNASMRSQMLQLLGARVRAARLDRGLSQRELCARAGVSARFLVQVEAGEGNPSIDRLADIAQALEVSLVALFAGLGPSQDAVDAVAAAVRALPMEAQRHEALRLGAARREKLALVGLRGAGKSTAGRRVAERWGCPFVELDRAIEDAAGMVLADVFEVHGAEGYRLLAREALERALQAPGRAVLELGGSLVADEELYGLLRRHARVVWLRASPEEHLRRVQAQGDLRPMQGRADALGELRAILDARTPLYRLADHQIDTGQGLPAVVETLLAMG